MVVAYLRVSTNKQHLENQEEEIKKFAAHRGLHINRWYHDVVSGKVNSNDRKLGDLLETLQEGDCLIVTEVSRLSRTLIDIMNIINTCIQRKIVLHSTKEGYTFENNLNSKILGFAFGLVAEIERNLISIRTKEALAIRKAEGKKLGRPTGSCPQLNVLMQNKEKIIELMDNCVPYRKIAKKYQVSVCTINRFVKQHINESK